MNCWEFCLSYCLGEHSTIAKMEEHVISMEQPLSTKVERTNGETSRDHDQSVILTEDTQNQSNAVYNEEVS